MDYTPTPLTAWDGYAYTYLDVRIERYDGPNCIRLWPPIDSLNRPQWAYTITDRNYGGDEARGWTDTYEEADAKTQALSKLLNQQVLTMA